MNRIITEKLSNQKKMIHFQVSAPGKVILYGEHAVVYGKTAVAASLDLRTMIEFTEIAGPSPEEVVEVSFPKVNLSLSLSLSKIRDFFFSDSFDYCSGDHNLLYNQVQQFIATINCSTPQQKSSLEAFFYLLVYIGYEEKMELKSFRVHLDSQLTIGSGLGSSASFAVCLAACFLHWSHLQKYKMPHSSNSHTTNLDAIKLEKISRYAFNCERIMHGSPSGIDNSICTYGSIVEFRKGEPISTLPEVPKLDILLVDTKVERSTKVLLQQLMELKRRYSAIIEPLLDSIDAISREALRVIRKLSKDNVACFLEEYKQLMNLIDINQGLLSTMKVSHPSLDRICAEAQSYSLAAKLTGAGGGGYAYILLSPDTDPEIIATVSQRLIAHGFSVMRTSLGRGGVQICNLI